VRSSFLLIAILVVWSLAFPLFGLNLVGNPGFEAGGATCHQAAPCNAIEGPWSFTSAPSGTDFGVWNSDPHSGSYAAYFAGVTAGSYDIISQTLSTVAGQTYTLSFWLDTHFDHSNADFQVWWNSTEIYDDPAGTDASHQFSYTFISVSSLLAIGHPSTLTFQGYNVPSSDYFDDVSVTGATGIPEPAAWMLTGLGLAALAASRGRGRARNNADRRRV